MTTREASQAGHFRCISWCLPRDPIIQVSQADDLTQNFKRSSLPGRIAETPPSVLCLAWNDEALKAENFLFSIPLITSLTLYYSSRDKNMGWFISQTKVGSSSCFLPLHLLWFQDHHQVTPVVHLGNFKGYSRTSYHIEKSKGYLISCDPAFTGRNRQIWCLISFYTKFFFDSDDQGHHLQSKYLIINTWILSHRNGSATFFNMTFLIECEATPEKIKSTICQWHQFWLFIQRIITLLSTYQERVATKLLITTRSTKLIGR